MNAFTRIFMISIVFIFASSALILLNNKKNKKNLILVSIILIFLQVRSDFAVINKSTFMNEISLGYAIGYNIFVIISTILAFSSYIKNQRRTEQMNSSKLKEEKFSLSFKDEENKYNNILGNVYGRDLKVKEDIEIDDSIILDNNIENAEVKEIEEKTINNYEIKSEKNNSFFKNSKKVLFIIISIFFILSSLILINYIPADIEDIKDSVVMIKTYDEAGNEIGTGSGFCAYKSNYIVTNFHVIEGAREIKIITDENRSYKITNVLAFNVKDDLAIISGNFELKPLKIGGSLNLKAGTEIIAIGSPKGQLNTVSTGVISNADNVYQIRITAPISPRK